MCTKSDDKVYAVEENMYWECSNVGKHLQKVGRHFEIVDKV